MAGRPFAVADYVTDDRSTHLVTTIGRFDELAPDSDLVRAVAARIAEAPPGHRSVVDLYLAWPDEPDSPDEASAVLAERLAGLGVTHEVSRLTVATCPGGDRPVGYYIFRPAAGAGRA